MHHACVVACALLIVTGLTLAARPPLGDVAFLEPEVVVPDDVLATFSAECVAREKASIFGLKRGLEIRCTVTAVAA